MTAEATTEAGPPGDSELKRSITGRLLFLYVLGDVLGSGIFVLIGAVAAVVGGAFWIAFVLVLAVVNDIGITESVVINMVMTVVGLAGNAVLAVYVVVDDWTSLLWCGGLIGVGLLLFAAEKALGSRTRPPGAPPSIAVPTGGA